MRTKINLDDIAGDDYAVDIQCVRATDLRRGAALLLNAHAAAQLGIISAPLSARGGAVSDLPEIEWLVDLRRLHDSRLIGPDETTFDALDCVPDVLRQHPSNRLASTMLDDEADECGFADDPELSLDHAGVCVTEADVERVLHECDREPFREREYSIDDITIGLDTTPAAAL